MSSIFGNITDTNVYAKKRFLNPENEYLGTLVNPTVLNGQQEITSEELSYLAGATGNIQDQLDLKIEASDAITFSNTIDFDGPVFFNDIDTPPHCEAVPVNLNDLCNKAYVDAQAPLTAFQLFCNFSQEPSPPYGGYKVLSSSEVFTPSFVPFTVNNTADVLIASFINTLATLQMPNTIPPGNWTLNSYSNVVSINDQAHVGIYYVVFGKNGTGGAEVILATSSVSPLISVVSPAKGTYSNVITFSQTDLSAYDRIGIKIYVQSNVHTNHSGTMFFQDGSSYTSLLTSFATTQAANILGNNNTWTGTNAFNNTVSFGSSLSVSSAVPTITSTYPSNDFQIIVPSARMIRLAGNVSLGGTGQDTVVIQSGDSPFNRQIARAQAGSGNFNSLVQAGDNVYIFGNNGTAGVPPTGVIALWGIDASRVGLRMSTTDYNIEGGSGNMTLRMNNTTAITISSTAVTNFANTPTGPMPPVTAQQRVDKSNKYATTEWIYGNAPDITKNLWNQIVSVSVPLDSITASNTYSCSAFQALCTAVYLQAGSSFRAYQYFSVTSNATPFRCALFGPGVTGAYIANSDTGNWTGPGGVNARVTSPITENVTIATSGIYYVYMHPNVSIPTGRVYCNASISNGLTNYQTNGTFVATVKNNGILRSFQITVSGASQNPTLIDWPNATVTAITAQVTGVILYNLVE